jgi:SAM-dependent methyltransferase
MSATIDWSGSTGDVWSRRWRDTDRGLGPVGAALDAAILDKAPDGPFRVLDVGCGPGTTSLSLAERCSAAVIVGCDIAPPLIEIARRRAQGSAQISFVVEDAETAARTRGPFDLIVSRHGVMFFADPVRAFATLRAATRAGGALVFSCFQAWELNPWASEVAAAAAGGPVAAPGREAGGFAFAETGYVAEVLNAAGWANAKPERVAFAYRAGEGPDAVEEALAFLSELGPAARVFEGMPPEDRGPGVERMRALLERTERDDLIAFPAAAWIWTADAA